MHLMPRFSLLLAAIACAPAAHAPAAGEQESIAITNVTVIPMTGSPAAPGQTILIRRGRIVSVAPQPARRSRPELAPWTGAAST